MVAKVVFKKTTLSFIKQFSKIYRIVKDLIRHNKTIINSEDEEGNTPLHMAALAGHDNVIQALLEVGANIESRLDLSQFE